MAAGGMKFVEDRLPEYISEINYTARVIELACEMMKFVRGFNISNVETRIKLKIGIHHGECMMGIIGYHKPQFSLIGDTINFTSRHCTTGKPGSITVSREAWEHGCRWDLNFETITVEMKGKGIVDVYHIIPKTGNLKAQIIAGIINFMEKWGLDGNSNYDRQDVFEPNEIIALQNLVHVCGENDNFDLRESSQDVGFRDVVRNAKNLTGTKQPKAKKIGLWSTGNTFNSNRTVTVIGDSVYGSKF